MGIRMEVLDRSHRPLLRQFENQQASLAQYLRRFALRHTNKDLLARTHVAIDDAGGRRRIAGYFSLATVSVERS
jgi:hypothetical protein